MLKIAILNNDITNQIFNLILPNKFCYICSKHDKLTMTNLQGV